MEEHRRAVHLALLRVPVERQPLREREEPARRPVPEPARAEVHADPHPALLVLEQVDVVVAGPDRPELLGRRCRTAARCGAKSATLIASSTAWSTGSSFLRPTPKLIRAKIESMIPLRSARMSSARRFVRAALLPQLWTTTPPARKHSAGSPVTTS